MLVLGIDPDTKTTGIGLVRKDRPLYAALVAVDNKRSAVEERKLTMLDAISSELTRLRVDNVDFSEVSKIVVEGQRIYPDAPRPQDIMRLAQVAGGIYGICRQLWPCAEIEMPYPEVWKGTGRKAAFTQRILKDLELQVGPKDGLTFRDSKINLRLPGTIGLSKANATHVIDGLGLALWGYRTAPLPQPR